MAVKGVTATKAATLVDASEPIEIGAEHEAWASRAAPKLIAGLDVFSVDVSGKQALDVGASSGGFTDVLLARGAARVVAVDVGYGQLLWRLRSDPRVVVRDRTNFRTADPSDLGAPFDVVVMDVSFISSARLAPQLAACGRDGTDYLVLVKPQFELGPDRVGRGGVVRRPEDHRAAVTAAAEALTASGIGVLGALQAPVAGAKGNAEFLLHGRRGETGRPAQAVAGEAVP